jgi:hypothetical protein
LDSGRWRAGQPAKFELSAKKRSLPVERSDYLFAQIIDARSMITARTD